MGSTSNNKFVSFSNQFYEGPKYYWMSSFPLYPGNPGVLQRIEEGERIGNFIHSSMRAWMIMEVG